MAGTTTSQTIELVIARKNMLAPRILAAIAVIELLASSGCGRTLGTQSVLTGGVACEVCKLNDQVVAVLISKDTARSASKTAQAPTFEGHFQTIDGRAIPWSVETQNGKTGAVVVNGVNFDLEKGRLFLISTKDGISTRQINVDVGDLTAITSKTLTAKLEGMAKAEPDIAPFVPAK